MEELKGRPEGCKPEDDDLLAFIRSDKCICGAKKDKLVSVCRDCYLVLPQQLRIELWRPWKDGFGKVYSQCIIYLETQTTRFTCPKNTSSSPTSISSSGKDKKKNTGKHSPNTKKQKSASVQETLPLLSSLNTTNTLPNSVADSKKSSSSQVTTNITEVIRQTSHPVSMEWNGSWPPF